MELEGAEVVALAVVMVVCEGFPVGLPEELAVGLLEGCSDLLSVGLPVGFSDLDWVGLLVGLLVGFSDLLSVGLAVGLLDGCAGLEDLGGAGLDDFGGGGLWQAGRAFSEVGVLKNLTSAARRLTRPWLTPYLSLLNFGSSWAATVLGFSPLLRRLTRVDGSTLPQPRLKAQLTKAPYWLPLRTTLLLRTS